VRHGRRQPSLSSLPVQALESGRAAVEERKAGGLAALERIVVIESARGSYALSKMIVPVSKLEQGGLVRLRVCAEVRAADEWPVVARDRVPAAVRCRGGAIARALVGPRVLPCPWWVSHWVPGLVRGRRVERGAFPLDEWSGWHGVLECDILPC
jgi:hypothetical protein